MSLLFHDSLDVAHDGRHRLARVKLCKEQTGKPGVVLRTIENAKTPGGENHKQHIQYLFSKIGTNNDLINWYLKFESSDWLL